MVRGESPDPQGAGLPGAKGNPSYEVLGVTRFWRYSKERMGSLLKEGRIVQTRPGAVPAYKRYLDEMPGVPLQDLWTDIKPIASQARERLGYPTQKPQALLERIIEASSNEGDVVLDPFCGCGTAVAAAEKLKRRWIGVDVTHLAVALMKNRLKTGFNGWVLCSKKDGLSRRVPGPCQRTNGIWSKCRAFLFRISGQISSP